VAKKSKFAFRFDEMKVLAAKIEAAGADLQDAADEALKATHDYITPQLSSGIAGHVQSGDTRDSLEKTPQVTWKSPLLAQVNIGFNLADGGWPSIFLMWGTPKMKPDMSLQRAAFGPKIKREVARIQKEAMEAYLRKVLRG